MPDNMKSFIAFFAISLCLSGALSVAQEPISIADAKRQEFGTVVTKIAGRVSSSIELSNTTFIQDRTGGIAVFNENMRQGTRIGDSVVIESGTLTEFGSSVGTVGTGLSQLGGVDLRFTVVPTARVEPTPRNVTIPNIGEGIESQLIKTRRLRFVETGRFEGNRSYNAIDNFGNDIVIRIDRACEIGVNNLEVPSGEVDITGVVSQFRGAYQILPRLAQDIGLPPIEVDTVNKGRTLDLTTWNLEWYGWADTTRGPRNKTLQRQRIRTIMDSLRSDLYALQEIISDEALKALSDSILPLGSYKRLFANDITSEQKLAYVYNSAVITPTSDALAVNGGAQAWANGRFPYRFSFSAQIGANSKRFVVFNIHAKATDSTTAMADYTRRRTDAETFHAYLQSFYADSNVIVMGDFNDRLLASNVDSTLASCYQTFTSDTANWIAASAPLEAQGLSSYVGFNRSFLDHILLSRKLGPSHHRTFLESPERFLSSYSTTVSDHRPVTARLFVDGTVGVTEQAHPQFALRVAPNPASTAAMIELTANEAGSLQIQLLNSVGELSTLVDESITPSVRLVTVPTNMLSSGSYTVVVRLNGRVQFQTFVVIR